MREDVVKWMQCPGCRAGDLDLTKSTIEAQDVLSGTLVCRDCGARYPVEDGVPAVLPSDLLAMDEEDAHRWEQEYERVEKETIDADRPTYKQRHRESAEAAKIDREKASYLWERLLFEESYRAFQDVPEAHGLSWTRTQEAVARRNKMIFELIERWMPDLNGRLVLNAGAGFDHDIADRFRAAGARVLNNDIIAGGLCALRKQHGLEGVCADLKRLPFRGAAFDCVTCIEVIHHCHPLAETLAEVRRILKPGGRVFVVENTTTHPGAIPGKILPKPLIRFIRRMLRRSFGAETRYLKVSPYEQVVKSPEVIRAMKDAGFADVEREASQYAIPVFPARVVDAWERSGRKYPRVFTPIAFEFTYSGVNPESGR